MNSTLTGPTIIAAAICLSPTLSQAQSNAYLAGDFHNHTVFTDGSTSIERITDEAVGTFGLDWFVQSGHGGGWSRDGRNDDANYDCIDDNDESDISWEGTVGSADIKGDDAGVGYCSKKNMWRWQSLQEYSYAAIKPKSDEYGKVIAQGYEYQVPGHEHCSHGNITGQFRLYGANADALAQFEYLFDANDHDTSAGDGQGWTGKIPNISDGEGAGDIMHEKAVASVAWLQENYPETSYLVWAHIERKGAHNPDDAYGSGYNVEHFRDFNNAGPTVAFGWEGEPGHQASGSRGGFGSSASGGGTYGGVGYYSATIGGMWDALLGEGRNWWFFGSSDWHNRGSFAPDDSETTNDFWPGEFQKDYIHVASDNPTPRDIIDGLRSGNSFVVQGDLIDDLRFRAKAGVSGDIATMGETLYVTPGEMVTIQIKVHDPEGTNHCPYSFSNPSLLQLGIEQPLNEPVLDHIDLIAGEVNGRIDPDDPAYTNPWNPSAEVVETFWREDSRRGRNGNMTFFYRFRAEQSMYFRLRGTNIPRGTPYETDWVGNPLSDSLAGNIPCTQDQGCPAHCEGQLDHDVEAWADLWLISNPIYVIVGEG
jgi:hypothetical protein